MRGATGFFRERGWFSRVSIHAPRAGSDSRCRSAESRNSAFQSTPPVRGATAPLQQPQLFLEVSIHAPRAGSDGCRMSAGARKPCFNPRPPCGERRRRSCGTAAFRVNHPPVRDRRRPAATLPPVSSSITPRRGTLHRCRASALFIHAPWGSDRLVAAQEVVDRLIHAPCGGLLPLGAGWERCFIHAPVRERPWRRCRSDPTFQCPPCGERLAGAFGWSLAELFQSTPPVRGATASL